MIRHSAANTAPGKATARAAIPASGWRQIRNDSEHSAIFQALRGEALFFRQRRGAPHIGRGGVRGAAAGGALGAVAAGGFAIDFSASGVGAEVDVDALPASPALALRSSGDTLRGEQACGGDDYELCFTAPTGAAEAVRAAAAASGLAVTRVGRIVAGQGVSAKLADGSAWRAPRSGYAHFS